MATDHIVRSSNSRSSTPPIRVVHHMEITPFPSSIGTGLPATTVLASSVSSIDLTSPSHTPTRTEMVYPMIPPTSLPNSPSYPRPLPFTVFTPPANASSHDVTDFIPELRLTRNTSWTQNPSTIGDHVNPLAVRPEASGSQRADAQNLSDSPVPTFPTPATVPSTSIVALAPGVTEGSAISDSSVVSNMEMLGRRENTEASNIGSQTFAAHRPPGSISVFGVIPMEPILPPEDLDSSENHCYPPLPAASEAQR